MKKYITLSLFTLGFGTIAHSQTVMDFREMHANDIMRYSESEIRGTARFKAMGGAMGALGGDQSAIGINPAGGAIFSDTQASLTLYNDIRQTSAPNQTDKGTHNRNRFDVEQIGTTLVYYNGNTASKWKKHTFSINYQTQNNYNSRMRFTGNSENGLSDYFAGFANEGNGTNIDWLTLQSGESVTDLYSTLFYEYGYGAQQSFLGYNGWFINPDEDNAGYYNSNSDADSYEHFMRRNTKGYRSAIEGSFAIQYTDKWFFGLGVNFGLIDYYQYQNLSEAGIGTSTGMANANFMNELRTYGTSIALNAGVIYQALPNWRVGLAYHSPNWTHLSDDVRQGVDYQLTQNGNLTEDGSIYPYFTNLYEDYRFRAPGKWVASTAVVLGGKAAINVDYTLRDYRNIHLKDSYRFVADNMRMQQLNNYFEDEMQLTSEVRVGAEYLYKNLSLRAGYNYAQTPYKNNAAFGDTQGVGAGFGLTFDHFRVDMAYNYTQLKRGAELASSAINTIAPLTIKNHGISLGLVYNFDPYLIN